MQSKHAFKPPLKSSEREAPRSYEILSDPALRRNYDAGIAERLHAEQR